MSNCENWIHRSSRCPKAEEGFEPYHKWIPISKFISPQSESVMMIMCGVCFHEVNISEAFKHREQLKP